jgi:hypothetical protein
MGKSQKIFADGWIVTENKKDKKGSSLNGTEMGSELH